MNEAAAASGSADLRLYVDGTADGSQTGVTLPAAALSSISIGGVSPYGLNGEIAELGVYTWAMDAPAREGLECFLHIKYNIPINHTCP